MLFTAECGGNKDAAELPFTVTDTLLETKITRAFDLSDGVGITPARWPVKLTFFDGEYRLYTDVLYKLCCGYYSRLDMRIASAFAWKELGFITEEEYLGSFADITPDGLARALEASDGDPELTARICAAEPSLADKGKVVRAMERILDDSSSAEEDVISAYLALAALGEPVMTDIRRLLESGTADIYGSLRLCEALAMAGDYDGALEYYKKTVPDNMKQSDGTCMHISCDDAQAATKSALVTASLLRLPEADMMARYLIGEKPDYDTFVLELMTYLKNYTPSKAGDAVFTYNKDGSVQTVKLDRHFGTRLLFTEEQFNSADFRVTSGSVYVIACYNGRPEENEIPPTIGVTKTLVPESGVMRPGERVTVNISSKPYCTVYDVIPSCGRYDGDGRFKGQTVTLWTDRNGNASYNFRITTAGEYVVESALVRKSADEWGASERKTMTVKPQ